ncbi:sigma-70 family RNA polymerase sigma factor [Fusibacter ferrireducens]|uniref:Sigma-70 family RNA polymerase sigma factor n=1 Tax=Fusibacter ferrireducens TaxID=2785058 RepID=A0ABR9ZRD9_9FIRM|nr:sigma-70 family RNA polymerase sigma factor [Fusibacter ferrireducens]MBF4693027.1 sigma-70 family RNA polymerase sigma factor [Fusibacter ferrireducens]
MKVNEQNVISQLKKRNPKALDYIVDQYGGLIYSIVSKTLLEFKGSGRVEECINDVLLAIWDNIYKFNKTNSFKSWIAAISKYKAIDYRRRLIRELHNEDLMTLDNPSEIGKEDLTSNPVLEKETRAELIQLLSNLNQEDQEIFIRRYFEEESTGEIAAHVGMNRAAVNNRLSRGRKKLKSIVFGEVNK